jgi:two-component system sensor histidine kinase MprB
MGLRWKIALALATVALIATSAVGLISYRTTSVRLVDEVDRSIVQASQQMVDDARDNRVRLPNRGLLEVYWVRVLQGDGSVLASSFPDETPVTADAAATVGQPRAFQRATVEVDGADARIHTIGLSNGAVQIGRSLSEVESVLDDLRLRTLVLVTAVSVAAALVGWLIAGTVAAPLTRLARAAEQVGASGDLDVEVPGRGDDEVGRLGASFRYMLGALAVSRAEQQRLVQDAGHELRTPLTSIRTNLSVLRRHPEMSGDLREGVLDDIDSEVSELTDLVNELVAAASGRTEEQPSERIDLAELAEEVVERVGRRRAREIVLDVRADAVVDAPRPALERAIVNLVDNACKFDQTGGPIEVIVEGGSLTVVDRGPGIPAGEEALIFDRFHRAESARTMPGSGLGLSIVRDVVERAGGRVSARARDGGGAAIGFTLPVAGAPLPPPSV